MIFTKFLTFHENLHISHFCAPLASTSVKYTSNPCATATFWNRQKRWNQLFTEMFRWSALSSNLINFYVKSMSHCLEIINFANIAKSFIIPMKMEWNFIEIHKFHDFHGISRKSVNLWKFAKFHNFHENSLFSWKWCFSVKFIKNT